MLSSKLVKSTCAAALVLVCSFALVACNKDGLTGGVAATVNGSEIAEDKITTHIQSNRELAKLDTEETWGKWLAENKYTPESYREEVIKYYVEQELVRQAAADADIDVNEKADSVVSNMKANYSNDEAWTNALESAGYTEESYRDMVITSLQIEELLEKVIPSEEATDEEVVEYLQSYASGYDGAKRSSHILFNAEDKELADEVYGKINSGELDFVEAVETYSQDTGSAAKQGDVGWDALSSFVPEYTAAVTELAKDQLGEPAESEFGYHIIKVTDVFIAPEEITSVDQVPLEFVESIRENLASSNSQTSYASWYEEYEEEADVVINPMPENVPYNLDMTPYEEAVEESSDDSISINDPTDLETLGLDADGNLDVSDDDPNAVVEGGESGADTPGDGNTEGTE